MKKKILYGIYFGIWTLFLIFIYAYQTDKYYESTQYIAPVFAILTLSITIIVIAFQIIQYFVQKHKRQLLKKSIIYCFAPLVLLSPLIYNYLQLDKLNNETETIELTHVAWACDCADWVITKDYENFRENENDTLAKLSIYIEPANENLELPDSFFVSGNRIKFTGQFYKHKKFPKNYFSVEQPARAKVFKYEKYEIIKPFYVWGQVHKDSIPSPIELK